MGKVAFSDGLVALLLMNTTDQEMLGWVRAVRWLARGIHG